MADDKWVPHKTLIPDDQLTKATPGSLTSATDYNKNIILFQTAINTINESWLDWMADALTYGEMIQKISDIVVAQIGVPSVQDKIGAILATNGTLQSILAQNPNFVNLTSAQLVMDATFKSAMVAAIMPVVVSAATQEILTDESIQKEIADKIAVLLQNDEAFLASFEKAVEGLLNNDAGFLDKLASSAVLLSKIVQQIIDQNLLGDNLPFPSVASLFPAEVPFQPVSVRDVEWMLEKNAEGAYTGNVIIKDVDVSTWELRDNTKTKLSEVVNSFWTVVYDDGTPAKAVLDGTQDYPIYLKGVDAGGVIPQGFVKEVAFDATYSGDNALLCDSVFAVLANAGTTLTSGQDVSNLFLNNNPEGTNPIIFANSTRDTAWFRTNGTTATPLPLDPNTWTGDTLNSILASGDVQALLHIMTYIGLYLLKNGTDEQKALWGKWVI